MICNLNNELFDVAELRQREMDRERQKRDWEMKERQREEARIREEEALRRQQDEMQHRLRQQEEEMRRRQQENSMFMQDQNNGPRPMPPGPPVFDRPGVGGNGAGMGMGNNGPLNLMDLPMVRQPQTLLFSSSVTEGSTPMDSIPERASAVNIFFGQRCFSYWFFIFKKFKKSKKTFSKKVDFQIWP